MVMMEMVMVMVGGDGEEDGLMVMGTGRRRWSHGDGDRMAVMMAMMVV